jgi:WD40 repeat protein
MTASASAPHAPTVNAQRPWPGLSAFTEPDQAFFFGRQSETDELLGMVLSHQACVLYGLSGLGKTSLLLAGLFPQLRQRDFVPVRIRLDVRNSASSPSDQVLTALSRELERVEIEVPERESFESAWEYLHRLDAEFWSRRNRLQTPVLVFDQFEEVLSHTKRGDVSGLPRQEFLSTVADLAEGRIPDGLRRQLAEDDVRVERLSFASHNYRVLLALREDYLADFDDAAVLMPSTRTNRLRLGRMRHSSAVEAILSGAKEACILDRDVAERIVAFVGQSSAFAGREEAEHSIEPALLSVVCRELNEERIRTAKPRIDATQLAVGQRILERFYKDGTDDVPDSLKRFLEDRLVTLDGIRELVAYQTVTSVPGVSDDHVAQLIERRVLRQEFREGRRFLELTHDRLAPVVVDSRERRRAAEEIERRDAAHAEGLAAERAKQQAELERAEHRLSEERRRLAESELRRSRRTTWLLAAVALLAASATVVAALQWRAARTNERATQRALADTSLREAVVAREHGKADSALAHAARALRLDAEHASARGLALSLIIDNPWPRWVATSTPRSGPGAAAWSPDGIRLAVVETGQVSVFDALSGTWLSLPAPNEEVDGVAWSTDGRRLASWGLASFGVWKLGDGGARLEKSGRGYERLSFAPGLRRAVAIRFARWTVTDLDSGTVRALPRGPAFGPPIWSPKGQFLAIRLDRGPMVQVFDVETLTPIGGPMSGSVCAFDQSETKILTVDHTTGVLSVRDVRGGPVSTARIRLDSSLQASDVYISPDAGRVALAPPGQPVRLYDARTGQLLAEAASRPSLNEEVEQRVGGDFLLPGNPEHQVAASGRLRWSPNGRWLAVVSGTTVELLPVVHAVLQGALLRCPERVTRVEWSPDAESIATFTDDGRMSVWSRRTVETTGLLANIAKETAGPGFAPSSLDDDRQSWKTEPDSRVSKLSPDGTLHVALPGPRPNRYTATVRSIADKTGAERSLEGVRGVQFPWFYFYKGPDPWSPVGNRLLLCSIVHRSTAVIWSPLSGDRTFLREATEVDRGWWSPDGSAVLISSGRAFSVWDARTGNRMGPTRSVSSLPSTVTWIQNGTQLVVGTVDGQLTRWGTGVLALLGPPIRVGDRIEEVVSSPDSTTLLVRSGQYAQLYDSRNAQPIGIRLDVGRVGPRGGSYWSADGSRIALLANDVWGKRNELSVLDAKLGYLLYVFKPKSGCWGNPWSSDGEQIVVDCDGDAVKLVDLPVGRASDSRFLAEVGELAARIRVNDDTGIVRLSDSRESRDRLSRLMSPRGPVSQLSPPLQRVVRWLSADPYERAVSPLCRVSVNDYIRFWLAKDHSYAVSRFPEHPLVKASEGETHSRLR